MKKCQSGHLLFTTERIRDQKLNYRPFNTYGIHYRDSSLWLDLGQCWSFVQCVQVSYAWPQNFLFYWFFFGQFFQSQYMTNTDPLTTFIFFTQCHLNSLIATIKGQRCLVDSTTWRHHSDLFWSVVTWHDQDQINCSTLKDDVTIHLLTSLYFNQTTDCCCFKNIFSTYFRDF